ncbi:hypothetical protein O3M35_000216 [Rhynocoris fuscipes]|uniref:Uncharacterized protein n=1 Tax=Rhynocoris fuscipes TaxID=488301 RepID=A0AAW1DLL6_9HEMI
MFLVLSKIVFFIILYRNNKIKTEATRLTGINLFLPNDEFIENEICGLNIINSGRDGHYCSLLSDELHPENLGLTQSHNSDVSHKYSESLLNDALSKKDTKRSFQIVNNKNYFRENENTATNFNDSRELFKRFYDISLENTENSETLNSDDTEERSKNEEKITLMQLEKENQDSMLKQFMENQRKIRPFVVITKQGMQEINNSLFKRNTYSTIHLQNGEKFENCSWREKKSLGSDEHISDASEKRENQFKDKRSLSSKVKAIAAKAVQSFKNRTFLRRRKHSIQSYNEKLPKRSVKFKNSKIPIRNFLVIRDMKEINYPHIRTKHQEILRNKNSEYFSSFNKNSETVKKHKNKHSLSKNVNKQKSIKPNKKIKIKNRKKNKKINHHKNALKKHIIRDQDILSNFSGQEPNIREKKDNSKSKPLNSEELSNYNDVANMESYSEANIIGELTHAYVISCDRTCRSSCSTSTRKPKTDGCIYPIGTDRSNCLTQFPFHLLHGNKKSGSESSTVRRCS